jgi:hypothetical protein
MHRMVSTLPLLSNPPLPSRLEILREHENAWKYLEWKRRCSLDTIQSHWPFEFANGVLGYASSFQDVAAQWINLFELPSANSPSGEVTKEWTHDMGNLLVHDFAVDPAHDLLVLFASVSEECVPLPVFCM